MSLTSGTRLGPYEILDPLGAGGMGEVYRARDTQLGRDIAVKALPEAFAHDAERLARFEREGRLLASLRHPNIAGIHAVVDHDGRRYLALEFVEGETLAQRIARGPLAVEDALEVASQVAGALEAAHEAGVIHRDLKPGNIMLRPDGSAVVLDFGLARGAEGAGGVSDLSQSPTLTSPATVAGVILGTAAYMSPEQARGRAVDRRADVWAFGCVLYEMLSGRQAFGGETVSDTIAAILKSDPDWSALPAGTPPRLRALLARCLRKDPRERLRDMGDARLELAEIRTAGPEAVEAVAVAPRTAPAPVWRRVLPWAVAALALALYASIAGRGTPRQQVIERTTVLPAPGTQLDVDPALFAISPDGRRIVFAAVDTSGRSGLWLRDAAALAPRRLCDGGLLPFWSPDGSQLAFWDNGKLWRVRIADGDRDALCESTSLRGGAWNRKGDILFAPNPTGPLALVSASGGEPRAASVLDTLRHESLHRFPVFLPDQKHFLFAALPGPEGQCAICVGEMGSLNHRVLFYAESAVRYVAPGWLLWSRGDRLMAQRFDAHALKKLGDPRVVPDRPQGATDVSILPFADASQRGDLAYLSIGSTDYDLVELDRAGRERRRVHLPPGQFDFPYLSPLGDQVIVESSSASDRVSIWLVDLERGGTLLLTPDSPISDDPCWSHDGKRIAFTRRDSTGQALVVRTLDGSRPDVVVRVGSLFAAVSDWTHDDRTLLFLARQQATAVDLFTVPADGSAASHAYLQTPNVETYGKFSPDDRWVVYRSSPSGSSSAVVQAFPSPGAHYKVSGDVEIASQLVRDPVWWPEPGNEILFLGADVGTLWSVPVKASDAIQSGVPVRLFRSPALRRGIAPSRNGQRFYVVLPRGSDQPPTLTWVHGWTKELER